MRKGISMLHKNKILSVLVILISLENVNSEAKSKCLTLKTQKQISRSQLAESNENIYAINLVKEGSESPKIDNARELMWIHYTNKIPLKIMIESLTKEGKSVIIIYTIQTNESNEWVIKLEIGDIKDNYEQSEIDGIDYEIISTSFYDRVNPIKPRKYGFSPTIFISKDNLPKPKHYRLLLNSSTTDKEIVF